MNVFISWSGEASKAFAIAVNNWLKQAMHKVKPWMSDAEIGPGERWNQKVSLSLKDTNFGIICVTPENLTAPWILFEAGALAKAMDSARVVPLLLGVKNTDLVSPLAQFQAVQADKNGFRKLAAALNNGLKEIHEQLDEPVLTSLLRKLWPELGRELKRILPAAGRPTDPVHRSEHELLGDVLEGVRRLERNVVSGVATGNSAQPGAADWQDFYIRGANLANNLGDPVADLAALRAYGEAIVLVPRDLSPNRLAQLYAHRGAILKRFKRLDEAENDLSFALKCARKEADINDATYHMASVKAMKGDRKSALNLLTALKSRDPRWIDLVQARGEYFPGLLHEPAYKKLLRLGRKSGIGRPKKARPVAVSNDSHSSGRRSSRDDNLATERPTIGAYTRGETVTIACFNKASMPLGVDFSALIEAMQVFVNECVVPAWGTPAKLVESTGYLKGAWAMLFLDSADQPGALAYHDLTPDGLPQSKVFVKTTLDNHDLVSVSASHELVEMLVDPDVTIMTTGLDPKVMYAYESADPVEELSFPVNGIPMTDFVYPAYFEGHHKAGSVRFDQMNKVDKPFQILSGGYQIVYKNGKWSQLFASASKKKGFGREDRRGHRSEQRLHAARGTLRRADRKKMTRLERRM